MDVWGKLTTRPGEVMSNILIGLESVTGLSHEPLVQGDLFVIMQQVASEIQSANCHL